MNLRRSAQAVPGFPVPDSDALEHSRRLAGLIRAEIESSDGAISFRRYMELALYAPGAGYYSAGTEKFGPGGDFVTAPEISPLYCACVARQCAQVLEQSGGIVQELGAGSGALACGVLECLAAAGNLPDAYWILEPSADLRARQQQRLQGQVPALAGRVRWLDCLPDRPFRGVVLANEVLDAMPVFRVRVDGDIVEMAVAARDEGFCWQLRPAGQVLDAHVRRTLGDLSGALPAGYQTEFNLDLGPWLAAFADLLEAGVILLVDYGYPRREYYHPDRRDGTLICHFRHRAHWDPFLYPGLQDISASVDFTAVAEAAVAGGLDVLGFTTQAHFLLGCGLHELPVLQAAMDAKQRLDLTRQIKRLTLPAEMGERFKAMALGRNAGPRLAGFAMADHRRRL